MIGCTVEKNSCSGIRVRASRLRLVMVRVSDTAQRSVVTAESECGAPDTVGAVMVVVTVALPSRPAWPRWRPAGVSAAGPLPSSSVDSVSSSVRRPVRARNTSSRLGSRRVKAVGVMPGLVERPQPGHGRGRPVVHRDLDHGAVDASGRGSPSDRSSSAVRRAWSMLSRPTSRTVAPRSAFSSVGVPSAMTRPWSSTARVLASRSASSRYWVVSRTVVPPPTRLLDDLPQVVAALGVEPGGGLVQEQHGRPGHQGGGQVEPAAHPARVGLERPVAGIGQIELVEQLDGPAGDVGRRQVVELPHHLEVLPAGQVLVDGGVLAGQADEAADQAGLLHHVVAEHPGLAAVRPSGWWSGSAPRWSCPSRWDRAGRTRCPPPRAKLTPSRAWTSCFPVNVFWRLSASMANGMDGRS